MSLGRVGFASTITPPSPFSSLLPLLASMAGNSKLAHNLHVIRAQPGFHALQALLLQRFSTQIGDSCPRKHRFTPEMAPHTASNRLNFCRLPSTNLSRLYLSTALKPTSPNHPQIRPTNWPLQIQAPIQLAHINSDGN